MTEVNRKDESIAKYLVNKSEIRYKYLSKFVLLLLVIFLSFDALSAECREFSHRITSTSSGVVYDVYYTDDLPEDTCTETGILTSEEFARYRLFEEKGYQEQFNYEAYDIGFEGVIKMFVAGMGIGLILAMLNRLRR